MLHDASIDPLSQLPDPGTAAAMRLTDAERAEAEATARRVHAELRSVVEALPEHERGGSAMSRALELDRATCQRLIAATLRPDADVETLVQLPGVQGLRQFLAAMEPRNYDGGLTEQLAAAGAAIDQLEVLIRQLGGSQRKLKARLAAERAASPDELIAAGGGANDLAVREGLFRSAAAATGRWSETSISVSIIRPALERGPNGEELTQTLRLRGLTGHHARADAIPLEVGQTSPPSGAGEAPQKRRMPGELLPEFCSQPLPRVVPHSAGSRIVHVIDLPPDEAREGADMVICDTEPQTDRHPAALRPAMGEVWALINFPSRRMVFDVYLHRDIAARCVATLGLHLWTPDIGAPNSARWSTRFPGGPRLVSMGPASAAVASPHYARQAELVARMFERVGWDAAEFVGFRCETEFPVWRGGYCMSFDFAAAADAGGEGANDAG